jgi:proteic killer suppression protein
LRVAFGSEALHRLATELDYSPESWERDVVKAYRKRVQLLLAIRDRADLHALRGLRLQQVQRDDDNELFSMLLVNESRLIVAFTADRLAVIHEILD